MAKSNNDQLPMAMRRAVGVLYNVSTVSSAALALSSFIAWFPYSS
jgi:hypothetical protein